MAINDIERLDDRAVRLAAYRELVTAEPAHSYAWCNYAVDLAAGGAWIDARRAALAALRHDVGLRETGPAPYRQLVEIGDVALVEEVVATSRHVLYRGVRGAEREPVLVRGLPDATVGGATALYGHHELMTRVRSVPHVIRALGTATGADGVLYQVLEHVRGDVLWNLFRIPLLPAAAAALVADVALALIAARAAEVESFDLRPEFLLRADDPGLGVLSLGPLDRRGDLVWLSPEERSGGGGVPSDVFRLGLLLHASSGVEPPAPSWSGARDLTPPPAWRELPGLAGCVARATTLAADARPSLERFAEMVQAALAPPHGDGEARHVADLRLLRVLGEGRFATVWAAEDDRGQRWAVKILRPDAAGDGELRLRFLNEASIAGGIDHPGVVRVRDRGVTDRGEHYVVMELAEGGTLAARLDRGPLTSRQTADVGIQVADAMAAVHGHDAGGSHIIHRDLKPSNLMLGTTSDDRLTVKVTDFGVAKLAGEPTEAGVPMTRTGRLIGTPAYMAPEQWMMRDDLDARADIYGLGAVLYHCLTGAPPFAGKNDYELQQKHLHDAVPPLTERGVPAGLAAIVERMLAKDPKDRHGDMREVAAALRRWRDQPAPTPPAPRPSPRSPTPSAPPARRSWRTWRLPVVLVGAPLAAAAGIWMAVAWPWSPGTDGDRTPDPAPQPGPQPEVRCARIVQLEWEPVKKCAGGREHVVWLLDDLGNCVRRLYDVPALGREVAAIARAPGAPTAFRQFRPVPHLGLRDDRGKLVLVDERGSLALGMEHAVFVSYVRSTGERRFGLSIDDGAPVFLSRAGFWCDERRQPLAPAVGGRP